MFEQSLCCQKTTSIACFHVRDNLEWNLWLASFIFVGKRFAKQPCVLSRKGSACFCRIVVIILIHYLFNKAGSHSLDHNLQVTDHPRLFLYIALTGAVHTPWRPWLICACCCRLPYIATGLIPILHDYDVPVLCPRQNTSEPNRICLLRTLDGY